MSMSTHVAAFKPPGDKWQRMKAVYDACGAAGVDIPREVSGYFEDMPPDPAGVEIDRAVLISTGAVKDWSAEMREGYEIDVTKLPKDVTIVRVYNSY